MALLKLSVAALATLTAYGVAKIFRWLIRPLSSPLRVLPGPPNSSLIYGNLLEIRKADVSALHETWAKQYGKVMRYKVFLGEDRLFTMDMRAINHVLTHSVDYQKPSQARFDLARILGDGILVTEGDKHKQQRRIMNPSFGPSSIKNLTPIFFKKALQLRDIWRAELLSQDTRTELKEAGSKQVEVLSWLSRTTLDVIGLAGFDYRFDSLNVHTEPTELNKAFAALFHTDGAFGYLQILQVFFPIFRIIRTKRLKDEEWAQKSMKMIGEGLVRERKAAFEKGADEKEQSRGGGADLLSALIRANMDTELPESQRMSDEDVLAQVPTFLVAGHETTSTETMWALYALSQRPDFQSRLRDELRSVPTDTPSVDDLGPERLPFLDAVVRETLRLHAAVPSTIRVATKDDVIPVSEPFVDRNGKVHDGIKIREGEGVFIPILTINKFGEIWGEDAGEFNPDRWADLPAAARDIPGVMNGLMTFLGGAHSCIGYRFAVIEMKALLFTLIRSFEFSMVFAPESFQKRSLVVTRPYLRCEEKKGAQMPLMVKLCEA